MNNDDMRCCGTGTCMINAEGDCWCGQHWDGEKMCSPAQQTVPSQVTVRPAAEIQEPVRKKSGASDD